MLRIRLLGELRIEEGDRRLPLPGSGRALSLVGWLALNPGMHARGALAGRFWPEVPEASARASLRNTLWIVRGAVEDPEGARLVATRDRVGLSREAVWTDASAFQDLVADGRSEEALDLCRGDLLAGIDDEWVLDARDEHRREVVRVVAGLARAAEAGGDLAGAAGWARRRVALDPLSEEACRELMRLLAARGDRSGALAVYTRLRDRLGRELGMLPSAETRAGADRLRHGPPPSPAPPAPTRAVAPALVGREPELVVLEDLWRRACQGAGQAVVIVGEGGIGKTRLVEELGRLAGGEGRVATGTSLDLDGAAPLGIWAELLADLVRSVGPLPRDAVWPGEIARLAPDLAPGPDRAPEASEASPELERTRLFEACASLVEWASERSPCALVLEDVHAADAASLALTGYVGRRVAGLRILLVLTRRDVPSRPEVDAVLDRIRARGVPIRELALGPLGSADIAAVARAQGVGDPLGLERVVAAADGNPLLAVETARALAAGSGEEVPATLRAAVRASAAGLDDDARTLAELAAVAGRDLEPGEVDLLPVAAPADACLQGVEAGLLAVREGRLGYRHALLREVMDTGLPEPRRVWLHEVLADVVARGGGTRRAAEIARHLRLAGRDDLAARHLVSAAADARALGAITEAADFLEEALRIRDSDPRTWLSLGEVEAWRGRHDASRRAFARAVELLGSADPGALAEAELRYARLWRGAACDPVESHRHYRAALDALEDAPGEVDPARAEALAGLAWTEAVAGSVDAAEVALERVQGLVGRSRPPDLLVGDIGNARGQILIRRGRIAESYAPLIAAADASRAAGRADMSYGALTWAACAAAAAGDFERSLSLVDRTLRLMRREGLASLEGLLHSARANVLARLGRADEARAAVRREHELAERLDDPRLGALAAYDEGMLELALGDHRRAADLLGDALVRGAPVSRPLARLARAEALAGLGRCDEADEELRQVAFEPVTPSDFPDTLVARMARVQGLIAAARGDRELAVRRFEESASGWRRRLEPSRIGEAYLAALVDLGRVPVAGLVEPARELARVEEELAALAGAASMRDA